MKEDYRGFLSDVRTFVLEIDRKNILGVQCRYSVNEYRDALFQLFGIAYPHQLTTALPTRRSEFLAGRVCAKRVLFQLGYKINCCQVLIGDRREPIWPGGAVGSISHSAGAAVCIGTTDRTVSGLGIDIERGNYHRATEISSYIVDSAEDALVRGKFENRDCGLMVVFSAKESIYKAAHAEIGKFIDFFAVKLIGIKKGKLKFAVSAPLSRHLGSEICVGYSIAAKEIRTVVCLERRNTGP